MHYKVKKIKEKKRGWFHTGPAWHIFSNMYIFMAKGDRAGFDSRLKVIFPNKTDVKNQS